MALKIVTEPASEPVTASEAKLHLRVDHTADDTLIARLITLARQEVERLANVCLITQTWDYVLDGFPVAPFDIPLYPLVSVTSIKYKDEDATETTVGSTNYVVDTYSRPPRIALVDDYNWPTSVELYPVNNFVVRVVCGFGDADDIPEKYIQAIHLLIAHYYENREAVYASVGGNVQTLPMGVSALLADDIRWAH